MGLLDVKEMNYAKYTLGNIGIPTAVLIYTLNQLGSMMESTGGPMVIRLAQLGGECKEVSSMPDKEKARISPISLSRILTRPFLPRFIFFLSLMK